jgi:hypothetical protein
VLLNFSLRQVYHKFYSTPKFLQVFRVDPDYGSVPLDYGSGSRPCSFLKWLSRCRQILFAYHLVGYSFTSVIKDIKLLKSHKTTEIKVSGSVPILRIRRPKTYVSYGSGSGILVCSTLYGLSRETLLSTVPAVINLTNEIYILYEYILTINVPVVYKARDAMLLMQANSLLGPLEGVGSENLDFFGP